MQRISQEQIAKELNISRATVSRALSNSGLVTEETKKQVMEMAEKLDYRPNIAAQELAKKRKNKVAVFYLKIWRSSFVNDLLKGIEDALEEYKAFEVDVVFYGMESDNQDILSEVQDYIREQQIDGLILMSGYKNDKKKLQRFADFIKKSGIKVVTVDIDILENERICFVGEEYKNCGRIVADLFNKLTIFGRGRHNMAVIVPESRYESSELRMEGFLDVINDCYNIHIYRIQKVRDSYEEVAHILEENPEIECIFSSIDTSTVAKALEKNKKHGRVLIGCDITDEIKAYIRSGWITFVVLAAAYEQGYKAMNLLLDNLLMKISPKCEREILGFSILTKENI
ncbi:LacI family transcriptional regulator [Faecalicatena contorta]|uniref:LacI family DNA-binding transcriptional regulator n=1 Tax=Faecalicatena contorta TaxID=39482 RepID=UPI00129DB71B|nr:LacI family transcriptional regulator [Faecalicatena contorta]